MRLVVIISWISCTPLSCRASGASCFVYRRTPRRVKRFFHFL